MSSIGKLKYLVVASVLIWSPVAVAEVEKAAEIDERELEARAEEAQMRQLEAEERLKEAQARLEEAAREVAELSLEMSAVEMPEMRIVQRMAMKSKRAMLGINIGRSGADEPGVEVAGVTPGGPADEAGIKVDDVLIAVDGTSLTAGGSSGNKALLEHMKTVEPGDDVEIELKRDGKTRTVTVATENFAPMVWAYGGDDVPDFDVVVAPEADFEIARHASGSDFYSSWGRMELVTLTETLGDYFGTTQGLLVVRAPGDDRLGLRDGDVIIRIGDREPSGPGHAMRILRSYEPGEKVDIEIMRKKKRQSLSVEVPDRRMSLRAPLPPRPVRAPAAVSAPAVAPPPRPASGNTTT